MKRLLLIYSGLFLLSTFFTTGVYPMGGKVESIPMKVYTNLNIQDGEFLRYGMYNGGDKVWDYYYVTRITNLREGGFYYRLYMDIIPPKGGKRLPADYTKWPIWALVDPIKAQTIEAEGNIATNAMDDPIYSSYGLSGLFYFHYQLDREKGYAKYMSKSLSGDKIITTSYTVKVITAFPLMEVFSQDFISDRLVDPRSPGVMYWIIPNFMKEPLPMSFKVGKSETLTVKAGTFKVKRITMTMGDPFLAKLGEPILKSSSLLLEDSDRRLPIITENQGYREIIEVISNVK